MFKDSKGHLFLPFTSSIVILSLWPFVYTSSLYALLTLLAAHVKHGLLAWVKKTRMMLDLQERLFSVWLVDRRILRQENPTTV